MDFKAIIDFVKYTIALSAACFAYALDRFTPMPSSDGRLLVLFALSVFFLCAFFGVIIFAAGTSAQHPDKSSKIPFLKSLVQPLGKAHVTLLAIGLVVLGGLLVDRVMAPPDTAKKPVCCEVCAK